MRKGSVQNEWLRFSKENNQMLIWNGELWYTSISRLVNIYIDVCFYELGPWIFFFAVVLHPFRAFGELDFSLDLYRMSFGQWITVEQ